MIRALVAWGPAALWAAVLFLLSDLQNVPVPDRFPFGDRVAHFLLFGVLGAALGWGRRRTPGAPHWLLLALGCSYGAVDEWHQSMVPGRTPEIGDFVADAGGVVVGYLVVVLGWRMMRGTAPDGADRPAAAGNATPTGSPAGGEGERKAEGR